MTSAPTTTDSWTELTTVALVGTSRRRLPDDDTSVDAAPVGRRPGASAEVQVLDAAAVGGALRRAGRAAGVTEEPLPAAEPDLLAPPPPRARQLLDLFLVQSPVGARLQGAVVGLWLAEAARRGVRVHHVALPTVLAAATRDRELRGAVRPVLDRRGAWLAAQHPDWGWVAAGGEAPAAPDVDVDAWALLTTPERVGVLAATRAADPAGGRELLASTWSSDPAAARAELLDLLRVGLSPDDEPLLESALDDRSARVRDVARELLDRLPGSRRARRLAAALTPLVSTRRGRVEVGLPVAPTPEQVRDGLGRGPRGRSQRGWWLGTIVRGAPLDTWTTATGLTPPQVLAGLEEPEAEHGIRLATLRTGDVEWARAFLARGWEPAMVPLLPPDERAGVVAAHLARVATVHELHAVVGQVDGPWSSELSHAVCDRLARVPAVVTDRAVLGEVLAMRLHPDVQPQVARLAGRDSPLQPMFQHVSQYLALVPTITEAFS